jgi:hypothetical protein
MYDLFNMRECYPSKRNKYVSSKNMFQADWPLTALMQGIYQGYFSINKETVYPNE